MNELHVAGLRITGVRDVDALRAVDREFERLADLRPDMLGVTTCTGALPGRWYVGLRWLTHRGSATLPGIPRDAAAVVDALTAHLPAARSAGRRR